MIRPVMASLLAILLGHAAQAADAPTFGPVDIGPGAPSYWDWSGVYFGGQIGYASAVIDPGNASQGHIGYILRNTVLENEAQVSQWTNLQRTTAEGRNYGGFVGYNSQWDDVILGVELNYNRGSLAGDSQGSIARNYTATDSYIYSVAINSQASVNIIDYGTARFRAGYIMGRFLPYLMAGFAVGRADVTRATTLTYSATDSDPTTAPALPTIPPTTQSLSDTKKGAFIYGFNVGLGLDVAITPNVFVRAEYEYIQFTPFEGITAGINTGKLGVGLKF